MVGQIGSNSKESFLLKKSSSIFSYGSYSTGIFLKVPSDLMTPGWMFLKKWMFIASKSLMLNFCTLSGVMAD